MERKEIKRYDFAALCNMLGSNNPDHAMLSDNVAMLMNGKKDKINKVIPYHTPVFLEEARIGVIRKGECDYIVNLIPHIIKAGTLAFLNRGSIIQIEQVSDDFEMAAIGLSDFLLTSSYSKHQDIPLLNQYSELFVSAEPNEMEVVEHLFKAVWEMIHQKDYSRDSVGNIFIALLHYINYLNNNQQHIPHSPFKHSREVFTQFIQQVNMHCHNHRKLSFYANNLCMSERYLSTLIKQESGQTAKEWIDKAVVTATQVMLKHTDKTITEISDELNFTNPSFFCKYFRRITGLSPQSYRNQ